MFHVCGTYSKFFVEDMAQNAGICFPEGGNAVAENPMC